jgi:hypothetical protein
VIRSVRDLEFNLGPLQGGAGAIAGLVEISLAD